jgi:hypothetical protein
MNYFDYIWKLCIFALLTAIVLMMMMRMDDVK